MPPSTLTDRTAAASKGASKGASAGAPGTPAPDEFATLYERYYDELLAFARRRVPQPEDAEDLVSQAFYKALRAYDRRDPERPFNVWLFHIARNLITDFYRTRKRSEPLPEIDPPAPEPPDAPLLANALSPELERALESLTARQQAVVRWRVLDGHDYGEVARLLNTSEGAVRATQLRALRALRRALAEQADDTPRRRTA